MSSDTDSFRDAYLAGVAASRTPRAENPYLPADLNTRRMLLAKVWRKGRLHDLPDSFKRG